MLGRRTKAVVLVVALLVLAVEGVLLVRYYDRYYGSDATSGAPSSSVPAFEATIPEGTMPERMAPERTTATGKVPSDEGGADSFVHRATDENSRGDYTYLSDPAIDGDPDAVVLVSSSEGAGGAYGRNVGVWYEPTKERWAIFNQDRSAVPAEATFEVVVPPADQGFVHRAAPPNTFGNVTYLDAPLLNGRPGADVSVTQNWNPGGGNGVYNDHPVGVLYDEDADRWLVYNEDDAPMPNGAAFNVAVSGNPVPSG